MSLPAVKLATYEDVLNAPAHQVAEIIYGTLHLFPRPHMRHARCASTLEIKLGNPFWFGEGGPGGWIILYEPELHLNDDILVPDLAGWRVQRMPEVPEEPFVTLPPDWVCEVLSPSTMQVDRFEKMDIYAREGVVNLWLVDPIAHTVEAYRLEKSKWLRIGTWKGNCLARIEPFDAIELDIGLLFGLKSS